MFAGLSRLFDAIARVRGYVPRTEMTEAVAVVSGAKDSAIASLAKVEQQLRHANRNLTQQVMFRDHLQKEIEFLRELERSHARRDNTVWRAVDRIDLIAENLVNLMQSTWPHAIVTLDDALADKSEKSDVPADTSPE